MLSCVAAILIKQRLESNRGIVSIYNVQYHLKSLQHLDTGKLHQRRVQLTRQGRRMHVRKPRRHRVQDTVSIGRIPKDAVMKQ